MSWRAPPGRPRRSGSATPMPTRAGPRGSRAAGRPGERRRPVGAAGPGPVPRPRQWPPRCTRLAARTPRRLDDEKRASGGDRDPRANSRRAAQPAGPAGGRTRGRASRGPRADRGRPARPGSPDRGAVRAAGPDRPPGHPPAVAADARRARRGGRAARRVLPAVAGRMAALHRHRTQFGCLDLQTGAAVHGQDLARAGVAAALASGSPAAVYRWSERARAQALLLPAAAPPDDPAAAAALEELRQARHTMRARELAGRPASGLRARIETLQRRVREQSWTTPGRRDAGPRRPRHSAWSGRAWPAQCSSYISGTVRSCGRWSLPAIRPACGRWAITPLPRRRRCGCAPTWTRRRAARCRPARRGRRRGDAPRCRRTRRRRAQPGPWPDMGDRDLVVVPAGILIRCHGRCCPAARDGR